MYFCLFSKAEKSFQGTKKSLSISTQRIVLPQSIGIYHRTESRTVFSTPANEIAVLNGLNLALDHKKQTKTVGEGSSLKYATPVP